MDVILEVLLLEFVPGLARPARAGHPLDWDLGDVDAAAVVSPLLLVKLEDLQVFGEEC